MKTYLLGLAIALSAIAGSVVASEAVKNTVTQASARQFFLAADPIEFSVAFGDLQKGPQGTFGRFPAHFETPSHIHSHAYRAVVISGEMTNPFEGEDNPPVMKAGSFWSVAANAKHSTACVSSTPCEFFMFSDEGFDFKPVE